MGSPPVRYGRKPDHVIDVATEPDTPSPFVAPTLPSARQCSALWAGEASASVDDSGSRRSCGSESSLLPSTSTPLTAHQRLYPAASLQVPEGKLQVLARNTEHPLEMDRTETAALVIPPPGDVEQRQDTVKDSPVLLTPIPSRPLVEDPPLVALLVVIGDIVLGAALGGVREDIVRLLQRVELFRIAGDRIVWVEPLGKQSIDAVDRLGIGGLTDLQNLVMVDEGLITHAPYGVQDLHPGKTRNKNVTGRWIRQNSWCSGSLTSL